MELVQAQDGKLEQDHEVRVDLADKDVGVHPNSDLAFFFFPFFPYSPKKKQEFNNLFNNFLFISV